MPVKKLLGRDANLVELGVFSVMWSEHCSYKSTRAHLKKLDQGGLGGDPGSGHCRRDRYRRWRCLSSRWRATTIPPSSSPIRARRPPSRHHARRRRPVAMMNALRFGEPEHPKTRHLVSGVVSGIGGYGNCMGAVGGEVNFHRSYNGNILVNAMCAGLARTDKTFLSAARGAGNPVVFMSAPRRGATAFTAPPWPRPSSTRMREERARCRWGCPSPKSSCWRPGTDGDGRHHRHPGHGRRGPNLLFRRDGGQGPAAASSSISTRCPSAKKT